MPQFLSIATIAVLALFAIVIVVIHRRNVAFLRDLERKNQAAEEQWQSRHRDKPGGY